jgi:hypothetical protein
MTGKWARDCDLDRSLPTVRRRDAADGLCRCHRCAAARARSCIRGDIYPHGFFDVPHERRGTAVPRSCAQLMVALGAIDRYCVGVAHAHRRSRSPLVADRRAAAARDPQSPRVHAHRRTAGGLSRRSSVSISPRIEGFWAPRRPACSYPCTCLSRRLSRRPKLRLSKEPSNFAPPCAVSAVSAEALVFPYASAVQAVQLFH